jgi:hypothetical protein
MSRNGKSKKLLFPVLILLCLMLAGCGLIKELTIMNSDAQIISGSVKIDGEWREITPPAPLKSQVPVHKISIRTKEVATFDTDDGTGRTLKFKDGRSGKVEAILYDNDGNGYELKLAGIGGEGGGFYLGINRPPRQPGSPPDKEPDFPYNQSYTKLKIRSEISFQCEKIEWIAEIQK